MVSECTICILFSSRRVPRTSTCIGKFNHANPLQYHRLRIRFLDIKKSNTWYKKMHILISRKRYLDIKKQYTLLDIKKSNSWYQEIISWYQEFELFISRNVFWGAVLLFIKYFLISKILFLDIKNSFLDIKKWLNSKTTSYYDAPFYYLFSISWYQECISWYQEMKNK